MDKENRIENKEDSILNKEKAIENIGSILKKEEKIIENEDYILEKRKRKIKEFIKTNPSWIFYTLLILLVILGLYIRYLPLSDHGGNPGLWDITTNDYTLGPDLDPFVFLRYAKDMITTGSIPPLDTMRNVPLGFDTSIELQMVSYMIVLTYKALNIFGTYSANYAGAFMPVWVFGLTIIAFFLFVRMIFLRKIEDEHESRKNYIQANLIALISTLFMIVMPGFLSRTIAGIPEKESIGFFFMFLAFYFYLKAWKSEKILSAAIIGLLAGISTALMGLSWGGVTYIYFTIGLASLIALILNKIGLKESLIYGIWLLSALTVTLAFTNRFSLSGFMTSMDTGLATVTLAAIIIHGILWKTKLNEILKLDRIKLPKTIISLIITLVIAIIISSVLFGPSFLIDKVKMLNKTLLNPITGRWSTTVAENRQPYFSEWAGNLGDVMFVMLIVGSLMLFKKMFRNLEKREAWILTGFYAFFLFGLIFSRYAPHPALFDGEGILSKILYYGSALLFVGVFMHLYTKDYKSEKSSYEKADFEYLFIFVLIVLCLFTARSAIRLIMVLVPIVPIFFAYTLIETYNIMKKTRDDTIRIVIGLILIILIIIGCVQAYGFYKDVKNQANSFIPNYYTQQWQQAMSWVRNNTSENAVFAHWWDYGYWVQSIGNRATVTDGGNAIVWWNYLTGRYVLTGDNQKQALEFLWNHNATHLLIDSSDIGKYGAFSQIGSNENYDRLSQGPISFTSDEKQAQETKSGLTRVYNNPAGDGRIYLSPIEEDIEYYENETKIKLYTDNTGLAGIKINYLGDNGSFDITQPEVIFSSQGLQKTVPLRYVYYNGRFHDFKNGINATAYIVKRLYYTNSGLQLDNFGAVIYISPRVMRGLLGQVYLLDDPLNNFPNFKLAYTEPNLIIQSIEAQGNVKLGDFVYYQGVQGPIKIWNITYTGDEKPNSEYLLRSPPDYITWNF